MPSKTHGTACVPVLPPEYINQVKSELNWPAMPSSVFESNFRDYRLAFLLGKALHADEPLVSGGETFLQMAVKTGDPLFVCEIIRSVLAYRFLRSFTLAIIGWELV